MDDDDDTSLRAAYDLDAWAPPAAPDVTAAVIARMGQPIARGAAATIVEQAPALGPLARSRRKWALAGIGFAATAVGALVTYLLMRDGGPESGGGTVATATPTRLDLGTSSAQLEGNTDVTWRRDGHALRVDQPRGTSTWTLGPDETIEIRAGGPAGGSEQVAIRATGASLRVEVGMNLTDAKIIGASAVAASAVAAVTIVLYEGQASVTSAGQTVEMRAGGTLEARADRPPAQRELVGAAPAVDDPDLADRKKLRAAIDLLRLDLETCSNGTSEGPTQVELVLDITPTGAPEIARLDFAPLIPTAADRCVNEHTLSRQFVATRLGGRFRLDFQLTKACDAEALQRAAERAMRESRIADASRFRAGAAACATDPACDATAREEEGTAAIGRGDHDKALASLEAALACNFDHRILVKAYLAACNARNADKSIAFYRKFTRDEQNRYAQICVRNGIRMPDDFTVADATAAAKDRDIQAARLALADDKWDEAIEAAEKAMAQGHPDAKDIREKAHLGSRAEAARRTMEDALKKGDYNTAAKALATAKRWPKVGLQAEKTFVAETAREVARIAQTAKSRALSDDTCASFRTYMAGVASTYPDNMVDRVRSGAGTCRPKAKDSSTSSGSGSATTTTRPARCSAEKLTEYSEQQANAIGRGAYGEAMSATDKYLACKFDESVLGRGFLSACNARDATTAKRYFKSLSPAGQNRLVQICIRNGIYLP